MSSSERSQVWALTWVGIADVDNLRTVALGVSGNGCTDIGGFVVNGRGFVKLGWADWGITTVVVVGNVDTGTVDTGAVDTGAVGVRAVDTGAVDTATVVCGTSVVVNSGGMPNVLPEEGPPFLVVVRVFMVLLFAKVELPQWLSTKAPIDVARNSDVKRELRGSKSNTDLR